MKYVVCSVTLIGVGLGLFVFSFFWPSLFHSHSNAWTEDQARAHSEISGRLHHLAHARSHQLGDSHGGEPADADPHDHAEVNNQALEEARRQYQKSQAELQRAQNLGEGVAGWMRWIGIAVAIVGVGSYYYCKEGPED
jgi:hypothetical protein